MTRTETWLFNQKVRTDHRIAFKMLTPRKSPPQRHYVDAEFLRSLGQHCRKLRVRLGYSIDRLSKEGERLSTSVVHRLESGTGAVTVLALHRYALVLEVEVKDLLDF